MKQRITTIVAWILCAAFSVMMVGKSCHHHHTVLHEDVICPLEGLHLSDHISLHTVISEYEGCNDDDCLICNFSIEKVVTTSPLSCSSLLQGVDIHNFCFVAEVLCSEGSLSQWRAPPFFC